MKTTRLALALSFVAASCTVAAATEPIHVATGFTVGVTHVQKYGSGEPALILIPGLTDNANVWGGTIAKFSKTHTIYALTLAGFGGQKPAAAPMIDKAVADVATLIIKEHLNKPVIVGHSLGGFTAIRVAEAHSNLLRGIVAVDGLPVFPGMDTLSATQRAATGTRMTAPMAGLTPAGLIEAEKQYSLPYMTKSKNLDEVATFSIGADPRATAEYMQEMISADIRPDLSKITVPFLELGPFDSSLDTVNPQMQMASAADKQAYYEKLVSGDPSAKVKIIDDSRHFIMIDQPQAFYDSLGSFLKTLP